MISLKLILSYFLTMLVFFAIDLVWLGLIAKNLYSKYLTGPLSPEINWGAAVIFYLIFIVGIFIFAILPAVQKESWQQALIYGALFGFFTYATYDLTNLATIKNWPLQLVFIDISWGTILTGIVSISAYHIMKYIA